MQKAGLPVPDFFSFALTEPLDSVLRRVVFPCVLKPLRLAASQGVIRANNPAEFRAAVERIARLLASPELQVTREADLDRLLVERYIPGTEVALEGLLDAGHLRVLALFDKPDPARRPLLRGIHLRHAVAPVLRRAGANLSMRRTNPFERLGLTEGPVHAEFRLNDSRALGTRSSAASDRRPLLAGASFRPAANFLGGIC